MGDYNAAFEIGRREAYPVLYLCISRTLDPRLLTLELLSTQISVFVLPADVRCPPSRKQLDAADAECPQAGIHTKTRRPQTLQSSVCLTSFPRFSSCGFSNVRGSAGIERRSVEPRPDSFAQPPLRTHASIASTQPLFPQPARRGPRVVDARSPVAFLPMQANGFPWRLATARCGAHALPLDSLYFPRSTASTNWEK